jgi:transcriptional regulator with XRE-family HTH domain
MAIAPDGRATSPDRHLMVSSRLRDRRHVLGLTQKQVVTRLASLGVSSTNKSLSSLEHGAGIDVGKLPELAVALDCTVTYLLGLTNDPCSWEPEGAARWGARPATPRPAHTGRDNAASAAQVPVAASRSRPDERAQPVPDRAADPESERDQGGWILGPYLSERTRARGSRRLSD